MRVVFLSVAAATLLIGCGGDNEVDTSAPSPDAANAEIEQRRFPSESMLPSFEQDEIVDVDLSAYEDAHPKRQDVVVYNPPAAAFLPVTDPTAACGGQVAEGQACSKPAPERAQEQGATGNEFISRVVALPGDTLTIEGGASVVNGEVEEGDHFSPCRREPACNLPVKITIPKGHYFMLGDNRGAAKDSRFWGPVPEAWIIGKVLAD